VAGGLGFAVRTAEPQFAGWDSVRARRDRSSPRRVCLTTPVASWYTTGTSIACALLPVDLAEPDGRVAIGYFDASLLPAAASPAFRTWGEFSRRGVCGGRRPVG
jgi:hypothetical protein